MADLTLSQREIIANIRDEFAHIGITPEQNRAIWLFALANHFDMTNELKRAVEACRG